MPRKKNRRKALQALRRKLEGGGIRLPDPYYPAHRISPPSDMAMAVAMSFAAPRMVMGIDWARGDDESVNTAKEADDV